MKKEKANVKKQLEQLGSKEAFTEKDIEKILGGRSAKSATKGGASRDLCMHASDNAS